MWSKPRKDTNSSGRRSSALTKADRLFLHNYKAEYEVGLQHLRKADRLALQKKNAEYEKAYKGMTKAKRLLLRKLSAELNRELDIQFDDALQATMKALKMGKYVKGTHEDPQWWTHKPISKQGRKAPPKSRRRQK